ncbi:MAG: FAD:protein FMN transferase [Chloroflexota bacterium]
MVHRLTFRAMGTEILACVDVDSDQPPALLSEVPQWFENWEQTLSRFRTDSELSRLNRTVDQPVRVSDALWDVFQSARAAAHFTDGLVTPTVLDAMLKVGYDRDFSSLPRQQSASLALRGQVRPMDSVIFDESAKTIQLPEGVHLDFGGIAKGWAAQQAMSRLQEIGPALMNCGGDIAMSGPLLDGGPWEVGVYKPFDRESGYVAMLYFEHGCGVASSATDRRRWMQGGRVRHHIIDPRTGESAVSDVVSATVVAPTAVEAEAAAKSILIRGSMDGLDWLEANPSLAGLLILEDGEILYNPGMMEYL